jgi:hypothetical protein
MNSVSGLRRRISCPWALAVAFFLAVGSACNSESLNPSAETTIPTDTVTLAADTTAAIPVDSIPADSSAAPPSDSLSASSGLAALDTRSSLPGIVFASGSMDPQYFDAVHTGSLRGGGVLPSNVLSLLSAARARGGRVVLKLCMGKDSYVKNSDGTFSLSKWKALIDRYKGVNLAPYIADGTLLGHFLIDEPHRAVKWGGKIISHATLEAMAAHSKAIWPTLATMTHTRMEWLADTQVRFVHLDAGWPQYATNKGEITGWIAGQISYAKSKGLGLMAGINVLDGGSGSSGIRGTGPGRWSMSAAELKKFGTVLLNQTYACGFFMWQHDLAYYGRSDIKSTMAALSKLAKVHVKTSCRQ